MSGTEARIVDEQSMWTAFAKIRSDADDTNWVVCCHDNSPDQIVLKGCGSGGLSQLMAAVDEDNVSYALLRVTEQVDLSTTVKFIYLHFIGPKLSLIKRGRYGIIYGDVTTRVFSPHHVMFPGIEDFSDITEDVVMRKVAEASGTAKHELSSTEGRQERNFTGMPTHQDSPHLKKIDDTKISPASSQQLPSVDTTRAVIEFSQELKDALVEIRNDQSDIDWAIGSYQDNDIKKPVGLFGKGSGGLAQLVLKLDADKVLYGLLRTSDIYEGIRTVKFVYISFVGAEVPPMKRGRISVHKGATVAFFEPFHVAIEGLTKASELTEEVVKAKIAAASGSKSWVK